MESPVDADYHSGDVARCSLNGDSEVKRREERGREPAGSRPLSCAVIAGDATVSFAKSIKDVTCIFTAIERADTGATEQLLPLVYDAWRKLAAQHAWPGRSPARSADPEVG